MADEKDPFEGKEVIKGFESLGRAIVDASGAPSGSPANWEATRGVSPYSPISEEQRNEQAKRIAADLATSAVVEGKMNKLASDEGD